MFLTEGIKEQLSQNKPSFFKNSFSKIFSWGELESLLNLRPMMNKNRFQVIDWKGVSFNDEAWLSDPTAFRPSLISHIINDHHCFVTDASRVNKNINSICSELENFYQNSSADAHIYFNAGTEMKGGFGIHWDFSINLIVQVEGNTNFKIWDYFADPSEKKRVTESLPVDPVVDVILQPGDAVFIPARAYHAAYSKTRRLSVSFPINLQSNLPPQDRHWISIREI